MNTYTYTARNAEDSDKVLTFTLQGEYLKINLTGLADNVGQMLEERDDPEAARDQLSAQVKPTTLKMLEAISGPLHVTDVQGKLAGPNGESLQITAWKRVGGLRAAPIVLNMGRVDNPQAAEAFLAELQNRKDKTSRISKFFGPLDYWLGWVGLVVLVLFFIRRDE
jgi:hypothetical protein